MDIPVNITVSQPTDLYDVVRNVRTTLEGTDYPGVLDEYKRLHKIVKAQGATERERRLFAARWVVAFDDYTDADESRDATENIVNFLGYFDLKAGE